MHSSSFVVRQINKEWSGQIQTPLGMHGITRTEAFQIWYFASSRNTVKKIFAWYRCVDLQALCQSIEICQSIKTSAWCMDVLSSPDA